MTLFKTTPRKYPNSRMVKRMPLGTKNSPYLGRRGQGGLNTKSLFLGAGIAMASIGVTYMATKPAQSPPSSNPKITVSTGLPAKQVCAKGVKPAQVVSVLLDMDTPPNQNTITTAMQRDNANKKLDEILQNSTSGTHIAVYQLTDDFREPVKPLGIFCDPGRQYNWTTQSRKKVLAHRQKHFVARVQDAFKNASQELKRNWTPLAEGISSITSDIGFYANDESVAKKLVIVTDGVPNVPNCNAFKSGFNTRACKAYWAKNSARLAGVRVEMMLLYRPTENKNLTLGAPLEAAWRDYFKSNGALDVDIDSVR